MLKSYIIGATAALALTATAASAATLSFNGGTVSQTLAIANNDVLKTDGTSFNGDIVTYITGDVKTAATGLGLVTAGPAYVTYTYLGFEAGNDNYSANLATDRIFTNDTGLTSFNNTGGSVSAVQTVQAVSSMLDFSFGTTAPCCAFIANNGSADPVDNRYAIGYIEIDADSFYVLFDDIAGNDRDFDDMIMRIDVAAVPLPAGAVLLLSALFGAGALRRRQKSA